MQKKNLNEIAEFLKFKKIQSPQQAIQSLQIYRDIRDLEFQTDNCYLIEVKKLGRLLRAERGCIFEKGMRFAEIGLFWHIYVFSPNFFTFR